MMMDGAAVLADGRHVEKFFCLFVSLWALICLPWASPTDRRLGFRIYVKKKTSNTYLVT